jgi:hypothetical protein
MHVQILWESHTIQLKHVVNFESVFDYILLKHTVFILFLFYFSSLCMFGGTDIIDGIYTKHVLAIEHICKQAWLVDFGCISCP